MTREFLIESRHPKVLLALRWFNIFACLISICFVCKSCFSPKGKEAKDSPGTIAEGWDKVLIQHARGFDISYQDTHKLLRIFQAGDTAHYMLLPEGAGRPDVYPQAQVIRIPVQRLVALSTTHVALADFLETDDIIVGLDNPAYVYDSDVRQRVASGQITQVGEGGSLNQEMVIALEPDLLMVSGMPGTVLSKYQPIVGSGIPVIINNEWMEQSPLAKAEWVKLMAALTNREALASVKFDAVRQAYNQIKQLTDSLTERPEIISGSPFQGAWYVPGARSYRARLYQDAGASWPGPYLAERVSAPTDNGTISQPVSFEIMYRQGLTADYWLNPGMYYSMDELIEKDERFADFKSVQNRQVFNNNRRQTPDGSGNDFFESAVVNPHRVLADLTHILHPELLPNHTLYYYQKLN